MMLSDGGGDRAGATASKLTLLADSGADGVFAEEDWTESLTKMFYLSRLRLSLGCVPVGG